MPCLSAVFGWGFADPEAHVFLVVHFFEKHLSREKAVQRRREEL